MYPQIVDAGERLARRYVADGTHYLAMEGAISMRGNRTRRWNVRWPVIRACGGYPSRILDRWAAIGPQGRRHRGSRAPSVDPSFVVWLRSTHRGSGPHNAHRSRQLGSRLCARSAGTSAPMRHWSRQSVVFERFLPWSRVACAIAH